MIVIILTVFLWTKFNSADASDCMNRRFVGVAGARIRLEPNKTSKVVRVLKFNSEVCSLQTQQNSMELVQVDATTKGWLPKTFLGDKAMDLKDVIAEVNLAEKSQDYPRAVEWAERAVEMDENRQTLELLSAAAQKAGDADRALKVQWRAEALSAEKLAFKTSASAPPPVLDLKIASSSTPPNDKCSTASPIHGSIVKIENLLENRGKIVFLKSSDKVIASDRNIIVPILIGPASSIRWESKGEPIVPQIGDDWVVFVDQEPNSGLCIHKATAKLLNNLSFSSDIAFKRPELSGSSRSNLEKALLLTLTVTRKDSQFYEKLFAYEKSFSQYIINGHLAETTEQQCSYTTPILMYYHMLGGFPTCLAGLLDPLGLARISSIQISENLKSLLLEPEFCGMSPDQLYQEILKKKTLTEREQEEVLKIEQQLSEVFHGTLTGYCNDLLWHMDQKAIKTRMAPYYECGGDGDMFCGFMWDKYDNPKVTQSLAFAKVRLDEQIDRTFDLFGDCELGDSAGIETQGVTRLIYSFCGKYSKKEYRDYLKAKIDKIIGNLRAHNDAYNCSNERIADNKIVLLRKSKKQEAIKTMSSKFDEFCK